EVYAVDLVEWALHFGQRPLKRPLPHQREVLMVRHLRGAFRRVGAVRLVDAHRPPPPPPLGGALPHRAQPLRDRFRPPVGAALDDAGLQPQNYPERLARDKLIEELLDRLTERGFLTIGDLRDALSRNQLKLPDLAGAGEFFRGDPLLRSDR